MRLWLAILLSLFLTINTALARATSPQEALDLVKGTTDRVLAILETHRAELTQDNARLYGLVEEHIVPHLDFRTVGRWVMGRHWREATPDQREAFIDEFLTLLVRTYASGLLEYSGETMQFLPLQAEDGAEDIVVRMQFQPAGGGQPIPISYRMHWREQAWKVYDVNIEGVSLVTNYRNSLGTQFASEGVEAVIELLRERNRRGQIE